ncbi:MAG: hypothetical protein PHI97_30680 [Desulfobulbus sp.]|nr:hypothetical protein [Desulfobulbus sp.]
MHLTKKPSGDLPPRWTMIIQSIKPRNEPMSFLRETICKNDALLLTVEEIQGQEILGKIEKIYSTRFEGPIKYSTGNIRFVGSAGNWGDVTLQLGEQALVFIEYIPHSERYYQCYHHGHLSVVEVQGIQHAVANWDILSYGPWEPNFLYESAFLLDPAVLWKVAMPYHLIEKYLQDELCNRGGAYS